MSQNAMQASTTALPLYLQISEFLTREIAIGRWSEGARLPPEAELAHTLGVATGTLRKALAELNTRGLLVRKQGSGTYIKPHQQTSTGAEGKSIYDFFRLELLRGGGLPTATVVDFQKIALPKHVPHFAGNQATQCYRVRRLRCLNSLPVAIEEIYFDVRHNAALAIEDLGEAMYWFYQQRLGFWISRAEDRIGAAAVPSWSPSLFAPLAGAVCPQVERTSWSGKNHIEEYSITWFDPLRCRYVNRLK
jgi:GntR family transcriptional regulator